MTVKPDIVCILSARNLGDAVIHAAFLREMARSGYARHYIVWTFDQAEFLFSDIADCTIVTSTFPMGATLQSFVRKGPSSFFAALRRIRRLKPAQTLELVSDMRERLVCRLVGAPENLSPAWARAHPFRRHNHMWPWVGKGITTVPAAVVNLYEAYGLVLDALIGATRAAPDSSEGFPSFKPWRPPLAAVAGCTPSFQIGLHPFASLQFKSWPQANWVQLMHQLTSAHAGVCITLFGAPMDRPEAQALQRAAGIDVEIVTGTLPEFAQRLSQMDLLVGLDSFSVHLAQRVNVPTLMLIGANDPRLFTPPGALAVTHPGRCPFQPCGGKPKCEGADFEYACMRDITPEQVIAAATAQHGAAVLFSPVSSHDHYPAASQPS